MKLLLLSFALFFCLIVRSQSIQKVTYEKILPIYSSFTNTVTAGMDKYNKNPSRSSFWENNVIRKPLYVSNDSIVYNIKFITHYAGLLLWGGKATFTNMGDSVKCVISDLMQMKKSSIGSGIDYINVKVDEMEGTKGDQLNLHRLEDEIKRFYRKFAAQK